MRWASIIAAILFVASGCGGGSSIQESSSREGHANRDVEVNGGAPPPITIHVRQRDEPGKRVVLQSGCLACHKIGSNGGTLGSNLTMIGARRSRTEIIEAIKTGPGIMPSFQALSRERMDNVVNFLAHLN